VKLALTTSEPHVKVSCRNTYPRVFVSLFVKSGGSQSERILFNGAGRLVAILSRYQQNSPQIWRSVLTEI